MIIYEKNMMKQKNKEREEKERPFGSLLDKKPRSDDTHIKWETQLFQTNLCMITPNYSNTYYYYFLASPLFRLFTHFPT